jgi:hypothetical protein
MTNFNWITNCVGGTYFKAAPDIKLGQGLSFQQTNTNQYGWLSIVPNGTTAETGYRLYNSSDPNNGSYLDLYVNVGVAKLVPSTYGSGTPISSINIQFPTVEFSAIGTTANAANAYLDSSNNLLKTTSSMRYKRDIRPLSNDEERKVLDLIPVSFRSKAPADDPNRVFDGLTAEQVAQHLPQFVNYVKGPDGKEIPDGVQYDRIAAVALLGVVKQQQNEIDALRSCRLWCMVEEAVGLRATP